MTYYSLEEAMQIIERLNAAGGEWPFIANKEDPYALKYLIWKAHDRIQHGHFQEAALYLHIMWDRQLGKVTVTSDERKKLRKAMIELRALLIDNHAITNNEYPVTINKEWD